MDDTPGPMAGRHRRVVRRRYRRQNAETTRPRKDGTKIDVSVSVSPICDRSGCVIGAAKIARDVTEANRLRRAEQDLAARLQEQAVELEQQIEEGQALQEELEQTNEALQQALDDAKNLLSNAIKFTDVGRIEVRCNSRHDRLDIEVCDTGRGIRKELLDEIFEPFTQSDEHLTHRGTGLGLAISRQLARGMAGDVVVHSEFGKGSTFRLILPRPSATNSTH